MKVTIDELLTRKEWLHVELLRSLDDKTIRKASTDGYYDVKILINDVEFEPKFYNDLINNINEYVDVEAKKLITNKLDDAEAEAYNLLNIVQRPKEEIESKYRLPSDDE